MNVVFMGSPEFALPCLRALAQRYRVVGVVTQPDKPAGRGRELTPPPIKRLAEELSLPVMQPRRLRDPEAMATLTGWQPDLIVVTAFGQILRPAVLDLPRFGCINVHASLLPRWRGAAPINAAILHGDAQSGATIMRMDAGVDTGPILSQRATPIRPDDTAISLGQRLSELGAELLMETLPPYLEGRLPPRPQPEDGAAYAPLLKKEDGGLDLTRPAEALARQVRAFQPWPGAFIEWEAGLLKVLRAHVAPGDGTPGNGTPGERAILGGLPALRAADGWLILDDVQPAGKKPMPGPVFLQGARQWERR